MSSNTAIRINNITKSFHIYNRPADRLRQIINNKLSKIPGVRQKKYHTEFNALKNINIEIKKGEKVGIIGKNGSGKSTLLQIVAGTLSPTNGTIQTFGRIAALLELGSGFNPEFTGRENININATVLGLHPEEIKLRIDSIIEFADIGNFIDQPVKTYSSGMFVRLAFAVIAHVDADILIIDEALAVGDTFFNQKCMRFMNEFSKSGTIILVTHDAGTVTGFCDRAIWINQGEVVASGETKEVSERYLASIYGATPEEKKEDLVTSTSPEEISDFKDARLEFINSTNLRNDLEVFQFSPTSNQFGDGGAQVNAVALFNEKNSPLNWVVGGEIVTLKIKAKAKKTINQPIVGFVVKNKLGQTLFGENTYLYHLQRTPIIKVDDSLSAAFKFRMPIMPAGDYVISVAIADGTQESHNMLTWMHDALAFTSHTSSLSTGLIGIPMLEVIISRP